MENKTPEPLNGSFKHWYLFLILGCIFLLLGIWIFLTPVEAYLTLAIFFAVGFFSRVFSRSAMRFQIVELHIPGDGHWLGESLIC